MHYVTCTAGRCNAVRYRVRKGECSQLRQLRRWEVQQMQNDVRKWFESKCKHLTLVDEPLTRTVANAMTAIKNTQWACHWGDRRGCYH